MRFRGSRELVLVVLGAVLLACLMTYPLIVGFDHVGRVDNNDGRWSIWVVSWVAHALTTDPAQLFRANIFYPHQDALAYSEANIAAGVVAHQESIRDSQLRAAGLVCGFVCRRLLLVPVPDG